VGVGAGVGVGVGVGMGVGVGVGVDMGVGVGVGVGVGAGPGVGLVEATLADGVGEAFAPCVFGLVEPLPVVLGVAVEVLDGEADVEMVATATAGAFDAGSRTRSPIKSAPSAVATRSR